MTSDTTSSDQCKISRIEDVSFDEGSTFDYTYIVLPLFFYPFLRHKNNIILARMFI